LTISDLKEALKSVQGDQLSPQLGFDFFDWDSHATTVQKFFESQKPNDLGNSFLSLPKHPSLQSKERFRESHDRDGRVVLMRRKLATEIIREIVDLGTKDDNRLFVHGAQGVGKSHALYDAVCSLMEYPQWRVIYVNDCAAWNHTFSLHNLSPSYHYLLKMIATGFHPKNDEEIWELCRKARSPADVETLVFDLIPKYCQKGGLKFAFVFDQHNGITPDHRRNEQYPFIWLEKRMQTEANWKKRGVLVISASANNEYALQVLPKSMAFRHLESRELCFTGFTDNEFQNWKVHHKIFHEENQQNTELWDSVNALLSKWPLLLDELRQQSTRKGANVKLLDELEQYTTSRRIAWKFVEETHYNKVTASDQRKKEIYASMVFSMYVNRSGDQYVRDLATNGVSLMNKHIMFWDSEKAQFFCINNLARQVFVEKYLSETQLPVSQSTIQDILASKSVTQSVKGSVAEMIIISAMRSLLQKGKSMSFETHEIQKGPELKRTTTTHNFSGFGSSQFSTQSVDPLIDFSRSQMLVPKNSNYPGTDLIFWDASKKVLTFCQVTVGPVKKHALLSAILWGQWVTKAQAKSAIFVWIAPNVDFGDHNIRQHHISFNFLETIQPLLQFYVASGQEDV